MNILQVDIHIMNIIKKLRLDNMFTVTVEHIYSGCIKVLQGVSLASIGNAHNLDWAFWKVKEVEFND